MDFAKFSFLINTNKLHFHRVDEFKDPFEGTVPLAYQQLRGIETDDEEMTERYHEIMEIEGKRQRKWRFLNCWHANDHESANMWSKYASEGKGIAIKSTIDDFISAVSDIDRKVLISEVSYLDFDVGVDDMSHEDRSKLDDLIERGDGPHMYLPILMKRKEFEDENEVRAMIWPEGHPADYEEPGINLQIDVGELINNVVISPYAEDWMKDTIKASVKESNSPISEEKITESSLDTDPNYFWK